VQDRRSEEPDGARERQGPGSQRERALQLCAQALGRIGLSLPKLGRVGVSYAVAFAGGFLFSLLWLPLPWMLGPLSLSLIATAVNRPLERPIHLQLPMRAMLGVAIGASFTPELLPKVGGMVGSLVLLVPYTAIVTFAGTVFLERVARFDRATAFFSAAPGGLADMAIMSSDAGADARKVTLVQASRVLMIVVIIPFWLQFVAGQPIGQGTPRSPPISQLALIDAIVICVLAWVGWKVATRIGLLGASMVGPLILSGLVHGLGLTDVKVPLEILVLAQMTLGIMIGGYFIGVTLREFVTVLSWGLAFASMLLLLAAAAALLVAQITGLDSTALLLSYSPGGQNEMNLLALILGIDVAVVALHHLLRVSMVVIGAQLVFKSHKDWRRQQGPDK
jgi:membrane AbrB-like protein